MASPPTAYTPRVIRLRWLAPCATAVVVACGGLTATLPPEPDGGGGSTADAATNVGPDAPSTPTADGPSGGGQDGHESTDGAPEAGAPVACSSQPVVLVSNVYMPQQIAADATNLYFSGLDDTTEADAIYQIGKGAVGGTPLKISDPDRQPWSLMTDGTYLYWNDTLDPAAIRRISPGGSGETTLFSVDVWGVALSATSLLWVTSTGSVESMPKAGGAVTTLGVAPGAASSAVYGVAVDANNFYFVATSSLSATISSVPLSGGSVTNLATVPDDVTALAADSNNVYFVAGDALTRVPLAGGATSVVAQGFSGTIALKVDSGNAYATILKGNGPTGSVLRVPVTGGTPLVIASSQWDPYGLTVDDNCVYWADMGSSAGIGAIMMAAK